MWDVLYQCHGPCYTMRGVTDKGKLFVASLGPDGEPSVMARDWNELVVKTAAEQGVTLHDEMEDY